MKKLIILFLFISASLMAQNRSPFANSGHLSETMGAEMITDGDFSSDTNWSTATATITGGVAVMDGGGDLLQTADEMQADMEASTTYRCSFDVVDGSIDFQNIRSAGGNARGCEDQTQTFSVGSHYIEFTTPESLLGTGISFNVNYTTYGDIDNFSLKKVL